METIRAFQCGFCRKIYDNEKGCKSHERKCYYKPSTKSCASCASFGLQMVEIKPQMFTAVQKCIQDIDVSKYKLKTGCKQYSEKCSEISE